MKPIRMIQRLSLLLIASLAATASSVSAEDKIKAYPGQMKIYVPSEPLVLDKLSVIGVVGIDGKLTNPQQQTCFLSPNEIAIGGVRDGAEIYDMDKERITARLSYFDGNCGRSVEAALTFKPTGKTDYVDGTYFETRFQALESDLWMLMKKELKPEELGEYQNAFDATCAENACDVFDRLRKTFTFLTVTEILP